MKQMLDALLVILVEHGMVSHVVAARLVYQCAPKAIQAAGACLKAGLNCSYTPKHYVKENP
jgi:hypothetical protein